MDMPTELLLLIVGDKREGRMYFFVLAALILGLQYYYTTYGLVMYKRCVSFRLMASFWTVLV